MSIIVPFYRQKEKKKNKNKAMKDEVTCPELLKTISVLYSKWITNKDLPYSRGPWWAMVHGITKSQTQLSNYHLHLTSYSPGTLLNVMWQPG